MIKWVWLQNFSQKYTIKHPPMYVNDYMPSHLLCSPLSLFLSLSSTLPLSPTPPLSLMHTIVRPSIGEPLPQQNHTLEIGGTLSLPVVVTGVTPPTIITWRNSSTELSNNSRVTIDASGGLTVTGVTLFDRGNYTLNVSNVGGNLIKWFSLFVSCE